jgi:hypothetical protein
VDISTQRFELLKMAIHFMAGRNKNSSKYIEYAERVRNQVAIIEAEEGRKLQTADWLGMAKTLGMQALQKDIGARQIAESIYPLLDGSRQHLAKYANVPAGSATQLLLWATGMNSKLDPQLKTLLVQIVGELQKMSAQASHVTNQPV